MISTLFFFAWRSMSLYSACDKNPDPGKDDFGPDPSCGIMHRLSLMS